MPKTHEWKYGSYLSSVYGSMFALPDESCFTYMDGWLIIGSRAAIDEYVTKNALGYTLSEYTAHAGRKNLLSARIFVIRKCLVLSWFFCEQFLHR